MSERNGYEIRADILQMAKDLVTEEFQAKFKSWELTAAKETSTGQIIEKDNMPTFPSFSVVVDTAETLYKFVDGGGVPRKK